MTQRLRVMFCAFCFIGGATPVQSENLEWIEDWYDIEVILFVQPSAIYNAEESREQLLIEGPTSLGDFAYSFKLTDAEKALGISNSAELDLQIESPSWFFDQAQILEQPIENQDFISQRGQFPEWLLPPGQSYESFLFSALEVMPFGYWFTLEILNKPKAHTYITFIDEFDEDLLLEVSVGEDEVIRQLFQKKNQELKDRLETTAFLPDYEGVRLIRTKQRLIDNQFHVIAHFHWHQRAPGFGSEEKTLLTTNGHTLIDGFLGLERGRFLHLLINLWMRPEYASSVELTNPVYEINEKRRVMRNEVNYFDHPKFGVIAEVQRLSPPAELEQLFQATQ